MNLLSYIMNNVEISKLVKSILNNIETLKIIKIMSLKSKWEYPRRRKYESRTET